MKITFDSLFLRKDLPSWFRSLNYISAFPAVLWPLLVLGGIFLYDNPTDIHKTNVEFLLIVFYPIILFGNVLLSFWIFKFQKIIAVILPIIPILFWIYCAFKIFITM